MKLPSLYKLTPHFTAALTLRNGPYSVEYALLSESE